MTLREFLGFGGYLRDAEGYFSWQHLLFVSVLMVIMCACALVLGFRNSGKTEKQKNRVLIVTAILINSFEIFKIVILCIRHQNPMQWLGDLPLFLCSIQLITIPLAAFSRGRVKEASLDFVVLFGLLGAVLGTYFAGNNYSVYPVISIDNVASGITHSISGFAALYIMLSGMVNMKKKNIPITTGILGVFCVAAYVANIFLDYNYMFLSRGDGTPYDIVFDMVGGHPVFYPLCVVGLFFIYIAAFYHLYFFISRKINKKKAVAEINKTSR